MVESQAQYIENLQQQIYVLENEVGYLYPFKKFLNQFMIIKICLWYIKNKNTDRSVRIDSIGMQKN